MSRALTTVLIALSVVLVLMAGCTEPPTNTPPEARAVLSTYTAVTGETILFDGRMSSDPDGYIVGFLWSFGDGSTARGEQVRHAYTRGGEYRVELIVEDDKGDRAGTELTVSVNQRPTAVITGPGQGEVGRTVHFSASESTDVDGTIVSYLWDMGDGTALTGPQAEHIYAKTGNYLVTLVVRDSGGATGATTATVVITPRRFMVNWTEEREELLARDGSTDEGEWEVVKVSVNSTRLLRVEAILTWEDDLPLPLLGIINRSDPDTFRLSMQSPGGENRSAEGDSGELRVVIRLRGLPEPVEVEASSEEEARAAALELESEPTGSGVWTLNITALSCGDGVFFSGGLWPDSGNSWTLNLYLYLLQAEVEV